MDKRLNTAMKTLFHSGTRDKRKLKAKFRARFPSLSSDEAIALVAECRAIEDKINSIASKSFDGKPLTNSEKGFVSALPLTAELKLQLSRAAMFVQFR